ncbi:hypothetical protein [Rathayibacter sp. VKM Ac-2760]|uniref:hypothetical protein n=1 Tax=Rathayibacter sp. VKM Ac-2760 TaxID=2609253 RepID=UPI001318B370|nr:hypothetical protein [Rathayibacter sp. VKM Ac-2760]QHC60143.1 hypothetical protein GSU72_17450 [Rathayibacter sp. VKM Ac-2760]
MAASGAPTEGQHVRFVRYVRTRDGWTSETRHGRLEGTTPASWQLRVVDELCELPRDEWSLYRP